MTRADSKVDRDPDLVPSLHSVLSTMSVDKVDNTPQDATPAVEDPKLLETSQFKLVQSTARHQLNTEPGAYCKHRH